MRSIYNSQNAPLTTEGGHFLPWKVGTRIGRDAINDGDDLQLSSVADFTLSCLLFGIKFIEAYTESL
jgi:hypothetical protein